MDITGFQSSQMPKGRHLLPSRRVSGPAAIRFGETTDRVTFGKAGKELPEKPKSFLNKAFGTPLKNMGWSALWAASGVGTLLLLQPHLAIGCFAVAGAHTLVAIVQAVRNRQKEKTKAAEQKPNATAERKEDKKRDDDSWDDDDFTDCLPDRHRPVSGKGKDLKAHKTSQKDDHKNDHDDDHHDHHDDDFDWDD